MGILILLGLVVIGLLGKPHPASHVDIAVAAIGLAWSIDDTVVRLAKFLKK